MYSIYHFFAHLLRNRTLLSETGKLDAFAFDVELLSCKNIGKFPDLAIRINPEGSELTGGELIELKDSASYTIPSFNSTIPTGKKDIRKVVKGTTNRAYRQMIAAGDDVFSLPIREVFYLIRGRSGGNTKVCLVHGSFFETLPVETLLKQAFSRVLEERISESRLDINAEVKAALIEIFSQQESFSKVRDIDNASVKLRFRVMTEAKAEGNILNPSRYPDLKDNTLNFVLPCEDEAMQTAIFAYIKLAFAESEVKQMSVFRVKHWLNGWYLVFQVPLR